MKAVSVIIPSFNRVHCVGNAVQSVLNQSLSSPCAVVEIIVVDDGSTDGTRDFISSEFPSVKLLRISHTGVSRARNKGIAVAQHEWIAFLDSDDVWLPDKLQAQLDLLEATDLKICHCNEIWIRNGVRVNEKKYHRKHGGEMFYSSLERCMISPSASLLHSTIFDDIGGFDEAMPACEDYDLWLRITAKYDVGYCEQRLIEKYGGHEDQLSSCYWGMDRFRVYALEKIVTTIIDTDKQMAALQTLIKKLEILRIGAIKRKNGDMAQKCERRLSFWNRYVDGGETYGDAVDFVRNPLFIL